MSEAERMSVDELRTLVLFEKLGDDQLEWLAAHGRVVEYPAGATIHVEGAPASCFLVLLSGMLAMSRRVQGGELELMRSDFRGSYTGAFNFYMTSHRLPDVYPATCRAVKDCTLFELPAAELGKAFREWFPMAAHFLEGFSTQAMENREAIERHERLVALGSVTAGLTHELNNPVAAVVRACARLREMLAEMREKLGLLIQSDLPADKLEAVADLAARALASARRPGVVADRGERSRGRGCRLVARSRGFRTMGDRPNRCRCRPRYRVARRAAAGDAAPHLEYGLSYPVRAVESNNLLDEITDSVERISGLLASAAPVHADGPGAAADASTCTRDSMPR